VEKNTFLGNKQLSRVQIYILDKTRFISSGFGVLLTPLQATPQNLDIY